MSSNERGSTSDTLPGCAESGSQVRERYVSDLDDIPTHHASADAADNVRMLQMENAALIDGLRALNDQVRRLEAERNLFLLAGTEQRGLPAMQTSIYETTIYSTCRAQGANAGFRRPFGTSR